MILGVIKDMIMESLYNPVTPIVLFFGSWDHATVNIGINPNDSCRVVLKLPVKSKLVL